jgi:hypothetical protein
MINTGLNPEELFTVIKHPLRVAALTFLLAFSGCATLQEHLKGLGSEPGIEPFEHGNTLFSQGHYEAAYRENHRVFTDGKGAPDVALFNMGLISAYSLNPKKDYPNALVSFRSLVRDHPKSPLAEQAKVWIQVLEEHQRVADEKQKLVEEKRTLTREREILSQEREKLKYTAEKSRQVDFEIEKRRRRTLNK